jgi:alkylation response protein AidB-like acyl-CoA dehydrogenase/electron transfer flavoprotein alpha subunit/flavin-dependent dehydrogenase/ferredoxin-like protein FixX
LARAGFAVAVVEAASFPGAENWSGCVYFAENLAHPDILGPDGVDRLAWERRLVERGFFASDGHSLLGMRYRDSEAFRHCYTVLRPIYDHHLGEIARQHGVALLTDTTAESLIRDSGRVVGVCTQRGALYADLVFLAEGDASHLVTREGYERYTDQREAPKFLQGIKQVIDMPAGAIEQIFGLGEEEGAAYEMLLRNGTLYGRPVHLNMGGFVYTNRQSLSVGLVLPAENLNEHFEGDPNLLMEWFANLPALQPWFEQGRPGVFGAKIIRGGGLRDIPNLIDEGLAIGGAASAIGIDFPYPNFTGPATAMGLLLVHAVKRIRAERAGFTREALRRYYLEPLQQTHYWKDVDFLRRWPGYVKKTQVFFGTNIDLALGTAYVWTRSGRWFATKWANWLRLVGQVAGSGRWREMRRDWRHLGRALRVKEVAHRPALGRLLLDGTINALRDVCGRPRAHLPNAGSLELHYYVSGNAERAGVPPRLLRNWFRRLAPVLAAAARRVYANNDEPLFRKLPTATALLMRQVNALDLITIGLLGLGTGVCALLTRFWDRLLGKQRAARRIAKLYRGYAQQVRRATDLTLVVPAAAQNWEARLGRLPYETVKTSHIHLLWPKNLAEKDAVVKHGLWHICPAHVYEARVSPLRQTQVIVNFENCIKCETCWRTGDLVDWGRDGRHRFIYAVASPAVTRLLDGIEHAALARPALPLSLNWWAPAVDAFAAAIRRDVPSGINGQETALVADLRRLLNRLERKLEEFEEALAEEPRTVDNGRAEYLEMLARYAQRLAEQSQKLLRDQLQGDNLSAAMVRACGQIRELITTLVGKTQERARRTWSQRYAWAAADGRHLRFHHLQGLRQLLSILDEEHAAAAGAADAVSRWLRAEGDALAVAEKQADVCARLDAIFPHGAWRELERRGELRSEADAALRDLVAQVPLLDPANVSATLHPPQRKVLLAELGRRDPSLAYRVACHLWARDLVTLAAGSSAWSSELNRINQADGWACFATLDAVHQMEPGWRGEALFVPARTASWLLLLLPNQLVLVPANAPRLRIEPLATMGLRGAGIARIRLQGLKLPDTRVAVDHDRIRRVWNVLSAADLTSMAFGMADQLCQRAIAHATSRVQFPGLFHDEEARDTIGKFGAIKKMVAEMGARSYLIETLDHALSPTDFSSSASEQAGLIKVVVAEALGTAPGSLSYNAAQILGGTGFSEDDIFAKYYRDAAAWRFLGTANSEICRRQGHELLRDWRPDGQSLARLPEEGDLFEEVVQRQALQAEVDEIRNARSRLRNIVAEWHAKGLPPSSEETSEEGHPESILGARETRGVKKSVDPIAHAEISEGLARQNAQLLVSKVLVLRTHARLEYGYPSEAEMALLRVWLDNAAVSLDEFEGAVQHWLELPGRREDRPIVEVTSGPPVATYAEYLGSASPYDSGDFLVNPVNLLQPRFVPDMIAADPDLACRNQTVRALMSEHFGRPRGKGLPYERYIEQQHRPDDSDLEFCRRNGFFRVMIPKELGGEGKQKIDYYLVITNAQRLADVGISLSIQVNTSIGTTPVLLARNKDLPRAQKEVEGFVNDANLQHELERSLDKLHRRARHGDKRRMERSARRVQERLDENVFSRAALKGAVAPFAKAWRSACRRIDQDGDPGTWPDAFAKALSAWEDACRRASDLLEELGRRREACDLFLRWVAQGQISAFALTEPSAGSDTARVATRATLKSVPVEVEPDGVLRFIPDGGKEPRYLLDARRLVFDSDKALYRWSETAEPSPIHFDEYDYETDDPRRMRYYDHGSRRVHFTDVAQLRERDGGLWYDYWEMNGAKMWITNGRMMGIMTLYAKTEDGISGVTGFIVDRHTEGLIVGKDEEKLGQCGSPTNELSLQGVRVPRENVLGLEGRGQVNALETLNVGRAGLAMSAMAQMEGLIESSRAFARETYGEVPSWVQWRLQRMEEDRFTAEALANEVVGRFEHPQTRSVRMESAISKMLVSESLHRLIELAEEIHGLAGQTQLHLVEKRKRDARVLNIYEGTNEVQRFTILKELASDLATRWAKGPSIPPAHIGREVLELETLKGVVRQRLQAALNIFDQGLWQNPNLQANCFLPVEAVAWLKAADSTLGRLAWISRREYSPIGAQVGTASSKSAASEEDMDRFAAAMDIGRRALAHCFFEARYRLQRFEEELTHLRRGFYATEVRAARLLFNRQTGSPPVQAATKPLTRSVKILVVLNALTPPVPQPNVANGELLEPYLKWNDADAAALETALRLRDRGEGRVSVEVVAVGPQADVHALREALSLGVDRVRLVVSERSAVPPDSAAAALALALDGSGPFDLILGGAGEKGNEEGLLPQLTAQALAVRFVGVAEEVDVEAADHETTLLLSGASGSDVRVRTLPAAVTVKAGIPLRRFSVAGYLAALAKNVEVVRWPRKAARRTMSYQRLEDRKDSAAEESPRPLSPSEAAHRIVGEAGLDAAAKIAQPFDGPIEDVTHPGLLEPADHTSRAVLAVLAAETNGRLAKAAETAVRAVQFLATSLPALPKVLLLVPGEEDDQRRALAQLFHLFTGDVLVVPTAPNAPDEVKSRLLTEYWPEFGVAPRAVVGEPWTEGAFACVVAAKHKGSIFASRIRRLDWARGDLVLETTRAGGKLSMRDSLDLDRDATCWLTLQEQAEIPEGVAAQPNAARVQRWSPQLERFYCQNEIQALLKEIKKDAGVTRLADANFIVDVGFGVANQDGYENVIEPLLETLHRLGVQSLAVGGSRKVTEEMHLLPADRQIGQSGVSVNPQILLAIGISGAPQHLSYIGPRATILAFNRDPEAPIMTLNQRQSRPRVFPVVGDLFKTVPALTEILRQELSAEAARDVAPAPDAKKILSHSGERSTV